MPQEPEYFLVEGLKVIKKNIILVLNWKGLQTGATISNALQLQPIQNEI